MELGDNDAAQLHAESSLESCGFGHWGIDGLKPYMRYSLQGGYQHNAENVVGMSYCYTADDGVRKLDMPRIVVRDAFEALMKGPDHRKNILTPSHRKVNVGLALGTYRYVIVQHFQGDYIEYETLPALENSVLTLEGRLRNGATLPNSQSLGVLVHHDPPPKTLTPGQLSKTSCYSYGTLVAALRRPPGPRAFYPTDSFEHTHRECTDPYKVSADTPPLRSAEEARQQALGPRVHPVVTTVTVVSWVTATEWEVERQWFRVKADLGKIVKRHGPGVYMVAVWAELDGTKAVVSEYSIFKDG